MRDEVVQQCALSKEGVATEQYCRAMNRQMNTNLSCCAKANCRSIWRFCPICIVSRASPIQTLRNGACRIHGDVSAMNREQILLRCKALASLSEKISTAVPVVIPPTNTKVIAKRSLSLTGRAHHKRGRRTTPESLWRRLDSVVHMRLKEKKRRLKYLSERLARCRVTPSDVVFKAFSVWTYQYAAVENVTRDLRIKSNVEVPGLWEVCQKAADHLDIGPNSLLVKMIAGLNIDDFKELGIRVPRSKSHVATTDRKMPIDHDYERFERDFDDQCRAALMRMSEYRPKDTEEVLRTFNEIPKSRWADWDLVVDPLDVAHALNSLCSEGKMSAQRAAVLFGKAEYWVQIVLKLHKLTTTIRGFVGPKASPDWRLQFGQAVLVSSKQPGQQLPFTKEEMWRVVRSRYKI